ncbi:MAG TPA: hypothetical protein VFX12_02525 [Vicinamibacterales bacterium]|nr:hypothetical protein [Vicinamibacterales bacterium]
MPSRLRRLLPFAIPLFLVPFGLPASPAAQQEAGAPPAPAINQSADPLLAAFHFRAIGPASMGGRIDDIAVSESNPNVIYVGYAVGGVFKSENNGTTFEPVFQTGEVASIGDIAIHPTNPDIVYVGTGEPNNRQTSSFGYGIYKTTDGGKTFKNMGLKETQTIARIVIDPKHPDTVYVASPGHLFGPGPDRGIYKTTDGGQTWTKIEFIDNDTGFTDIALDPRNSSVIYAASYQRRRTSCCFNGGGPGSGLWKSANAGRSWTKITGAGLPPGTYGRIALDVSRSKPGVVYAQIEAGASNTPEKVEPAPAQPAATPERTPPGASTVPPPAPTPAGRARAAQPPPPPAGQRFDWCNNGGPTHGFVTGRGGEAPPENAVAPTLDPAKGGVLRSNDSGKSWTLVSNCDARPMYFSQLRVDPSNDQVVYVAGLPVAKSLDGGHTFTTLDRAGGLGEPGHVDQHAIWVDPRNPNHLMIGNDGGLDVTYDQGKNWDYVNIMPTALAYVVTADMRHPYYVYIGLQDNGSWGGPSAVRGRGGIMNSDWFGIGGGDGFYTAVDPTDYHIVYSESQDGNTNRYDLRLGRGTSIKPRDAFKPTRGGGFGRGGNQTPNVLNMKTSTEEFRFNWNTPVVLSPHNPSIVWLGGNRLFKSYDRGDTWVASEDLTKQVDRSKVTVMGVPGDRTQLSKNDGLEAYSTIISISESPVMPGIVWAGTDDGNLQVSRDGGSTFTNVAKNLPGLPPDNFYWISRIDASHFDPATAYVAVDGHRSDDLKPYIFVTHDYGQTFQSITGNLPSYGNVQVIREDPKNKSLLYVGTEFGLYISLNGGQSWQKFMTDYPTVRTDDILVHPRDNDLIVATHGRSIYILDDITPLQQLTPQVQAEDAHLFDVRPGVAWLNDQEHGQQVGGQKVFVGENAPRGTAISYFLKSAASGDVKITIADATGKVIRNLDGTKTAGINRVMWDLTPNPPPGRGGRGGGGFFRFSPPVEPGTYIVTLEVNGKKLTKPVQVLEDRWLEER